MLLEHIKNIYIKFFVATEDYEILCNLLQKKKRIKIPGQKAERTVILETRRAIKETAADISELHQQSKRYQCTGIQFKSQYEIKIFYQSSIFYTMNRDTVQVTEVMKC